MFEVEFDLAKNAAKEAGKFLLKNSHEEKEILSSSGKDIKLMLDIQSEEIIKNKITQNSTYPLLCEESGLIEGPQSSNALQWIVDPLDGTFNYQNHIPFSCVSLELWKNNETVLGVLYDFNNDELLSGMVGQGVWLNDKRIELGTHHALDQACLATGLPVHMEMNRNSGLQFVSKIEKFKKVRMIGSAASSLGMIAKSQVDAYYEHNIMIWDVAAGLAIVKAMGGAFDLQSGTKPFSYVVNCASSVSLLNTMMEIL